MPGRRWGGNANEYLSDACARRAFPARFRNVHLRSAMPPRPIIIDTDPGLDDALAILLAFASPEDHNAGFYGLLTERLARLR